VATKCDENVGIVAFGIDVGTEQVEHLLDNVMKTKGWAE